MTKMYYLQLPVLINLNIHTCTVTHMPYTFHAVTQWWLNLLENVGTQ